MDVKSLGLDLTGEALNIDGVGNGEHCQTAILQLAELSSYIKTKTRKIPTPKEVANPIFCFSF